MAKSLRIKKSQPKSRTSKGYSPAKDNLMTATNMYMRNINEHALLSEEEEAALCTDLFGDDKEASERAKMVLIESNLRLVVKIAHEFKNTRLPLRELISAGNDGLIYAVKKFDPDKGARFGTYAVWWIKQSIRRAIEHQTNAIRVPTQTANKQRKVKDAKALLTRRLGRAPTDAEIGEAVGLSERVVTTLQRLDLSFLSLHDLVGSEDSTEFMELIPDDKAASPDKLLWDNDSIDQLYHLMGQLKDREQLVLALRFGLDGEEPKTLEDIADQLGITRERIRQIQNAALVKIRKMMNKRK